MGVVLAVVIAAVAACSGGTEPAPDGTPAAAVQTDPARARLLGALPPQEAARGVYVVDLATAGDLNPGSRLAPLLGGLVEDAALLVETTAPPITLLGGVRKGAAVPDQAARVGDTIVLADPAVRDAVVARLRDGAQPEGPLMELAGAGPPVGWIGPTPTAAGAGTTVVQAGTGEITFRVLAAPPAAVDGVDRELAEGAPPGSPGKPWRDILDDAVVTHESGALLVTAAPRDLPGLLLRSLVDQRQLSFLPAG